MTPDQIQLVKQSFSKLEPVVEEAAVLFYARLFELDPALRQLFRIDIRDQGHKLMQIIGYAVDHLDRLDDLLPTLRELGERHVQYGVKDSHYDTVGDALLWTLAKALKADYTNEINTAWTAVYKLMADAMKSHSAVSSDHTVAAK